MKSCNNCIHHDICNTYAALSKDVEQCQHYLKIEDDIKDPYKMSEEWNEYLVNYTKACGEFLILNAKEIVGTYRFINEIDIKIPIDAGKLDEIPTISISKEFTAPKVDDLIGAFYTKRNERNTTEIGLRVEEKDDD